MKKLFSLEELCEFSLETAKEFLIDKPTAQLLPTFHIQFYDRPPSIIATPWRGDHEKAVTFRVMRAALKQFRPSIDSYSFMSEAWIATQDTEPKDTDPLPSDRPDSIEAVIITCFTKKTGFMRVYKIKRGPNGRVAELVPETRVPEHFEGRAYNLFEDPE